MKEPENDFLVYNGIPAPDGEDSVDHVCRMLSENSPVLCPRLHALVVMLARDTIAGAEQYRCNASSLVAMANTRSRMGHRICRFYIQTVRSAGRRWVFRSEEELMGPLFQPLADCVDEYRPCGQAASSLASALAQTRGTRRRQRPTRKGTVSWGTQSTSISRIFRTLRPHIVDTPSLRTRFKFPKSLVYLYFLALVVL